LQQSCQAGNTAIIKRNCLAEWVPAQLLFSTVFRLERIIPEAYLAVHPTIGNRDFAAMQAGTLVA
jgi:hypothetical protein